MGSYWLGRLDGNRRRGTGELREQRGGNERDRKTLTAQEEEKEKRNGREGATGKRGKERGREREGG